MTVVVHVCHGRTKNAHVMMMMMMMRHLKAFIS